MTNRPRHGALGANTPMGPVLLATALLACRAPNTASPAPSPGTAASASVIAATACAEPSAAGRNAIASLSISVTPAPSPSIPVAIYIEGELSKSVTRDSTEQLHRYELPRGLYDVRVSMPGFNTAMARVTLTAGCNAELTAVLRKRVARGR